MVVQRCIINRAAVPACNGVRARAHGRAFDSGFQVGGQDPPLRRRETHFHGRSLLRNPFLDTASDPEIRRVSRCVGSGTRDRESAVGASRPPENVRSFVAAARPGKDAFSATFPSIPARKIRTSDAYQSTDSSFHRALSERTLGVAGRMSSPRRSPRESTLAADHRCNPQSTSARTRD